MGEITTGISNSHGAYGTSDTWAAANEDILQGAAYDWKMYHTTIKLNNITLEENKGASRILDLAAIKLRNAARVLKKDLITDFYATAIDGTDHMVGLKSVCLADPGASPAPLIGGIDQHTYSWWRGNLEAKSPAEDLSWSILNAMYHDTKKYGNGDAATIIVTTPGVLESYENNLTKTVVTGQITPTTAATTQAGVYLTAPTTQKVIDGGFLAFSFKNIPIVADPLLTDTGYLYFLNENYIHWRVLKNFASTGWQDLRTQGKDYLQLTIWGYGAMTYSSPRKLGKITGLNEA
jgi:hypothetical protein